jgi:2-polyprenyl-6-methoxyphenol hydroxylase-like FAD-dependent oxidoreductase
MKIAISGAGVAGPTLAHWLMRQGHDPTLIEAAPTLRAGGYMADGHPGRARPVDRRPDER